MSEIERVIELWDSLPWHEFHVALKRDGWERDKSGHNKIVFWKGDLVVKYDDDGHTADEFDYWNRSDERWHLASVLAYHHGLMVQERLTICAGPCQHRPAKRLARRLGVPDYTHHGVDRCGSLKFFDYGPLGEE